MVNQNIEKISEENKKLKNLLNIKADTFSVGIHQIKNSLSALKWIIKMFLDGDLGKLSVEQKDLLQKTYHENERALNTANELLRINREEKIEERKNELINFDIVDLIEEAVFNFSGEARSRNIEIIFLKPKKDSIKIKADKNKIRIVIQNLLENAIKYSHPAGKIFITLIEEKDKIKISFKDTGIGISEKGQKEIFNKFFRDEKAIQKDSFGTGIGLYTVKKIITEHNGLINFESTEKVGSTFYVILPKK